MLNYVAIMFAQACSIYVAATTKNRTRSIVLYSYWQQVQLFYNKTMRFIFIFLLIMTHTHNYAGYKIKAPYAWAFPLKKLKLTILMWLQNIDQFEEALTSLGNAFRHFTIH